MVHMVNIYNIVLVSILPERWGQFKLPDIKGNLYYQRLKINTKYFHITGINDLSITTSYHDITHFVPTRIFAGNCFLNGWEIFNHTLIQKCILIRRCMNNSHYC